MGIRMGTGKSIYEAHPDWAKLPKGWRFLEVLDAAVDSQDRVYVFSRGEHPLMIFDREGNFLDSWGEGQFKRPHGITIGPSDTLYLADDGGHAIYQFTLEGKPLMTLGTPGKAAEFMGGRPFNHPTKVAREPQSGNLFVSDGYGNARVHKARAVQEQIWRIDAAQPVTNVRPMKEWVGESVSVERFSAGLFLGFALIGLVLAAIGLFGVLAYAVSQRTHEFGVRLAMGAQIGEILRLVLIQGLKVAGMGVGLGLAGALVLSVVLQSLLFEMRAQDPLTFLVDVLFLGLVALAACYLPARRATKVDPMVALRCE